MNYPFNEKFLFEAAPAEDTLPDETTGTNEPVSTNPEDKPDPSLAEDLTGGSTDESSDLKSQVEDLQAQIDELQKKFDLETEVESLKKKLENINVTDKADLNNSINQSAFRQIKHLKRAIRRFLSKNITSSLTGKQQNLIVSELDQHPNLSCQEISAKLAPELKASEQDIFDFIRNSDYRFRHRHWRESSVIDWDVAN